MSDGKTLICVALIVGIPAACCVAAFHLSEKKEDKPKEIELSEQAKMDETEYPVYLYVDHNDCYHKSLDCFHLNPQMSEFRYLIDVVNISGEVNYPVKRKHIFDTTNDDIKWTCSGCISDEDYEVIMEMTKPNAKYNEKFKNVSGWGQPHQDDSKTPPSKRLSSDGFSWVEGGKKKKIDW